MAHFVNAAEARISNSIQKVGLKSKLTIGVWGAAGLNVGPNDRSIATIRDLGPDNRNHRWFELSPVKSGNVMVEAKNGASVWDFFQLAITAESAPKLVERRADGKYTDSPNEEVTRQTIVTARQLDDYLINKMPEIGPQGRRLLVAQAMHETGNGINCYNSNVGNLIAGTKSPHMYLKATPNCVVTSKLEAELAKGNVTVATGADKGRIGCASNQTVVFYHPPHDKTRFRAFINFESGAAAWVAKHREIAKKSPGYVDALNTGNVQNVAAAMKQARYFESSESSYSNRMTEKAGTK